MRRVRRWAATALVLVAGTGCGGSDTTGPTSGQITLTPDAVIVAQGQGVHLSVTVLDDQGRLLTGTPVTFESSDTLIVTVSAAGAVRSVGPAGFATVTARAGRLSTEVAVAVTPTASRLAVTPAALTIPQKGTAQLSGVLLDAAGDPVPHSPVTFLSTNIAVATVSADGFVTSVGPAGQAQITVSSGRLFVQVPVSVPQSPSAIFVTPNPVTLITGASVQLSVRVVDAVGADIAGSSVSYSATPAGLISVTPTGRLSSVGGPGTGTVTVTSGPLRLDVPVTVNQQVPTSITVSPNPITLAVGHSLQTTARVLDANQLEIVGSAFTYSAAPAALITVSAGGVVTSVGGAGTGTLTVQSGTLQLDVPVTVVDVGHPVGTIVATTPMGGAPYGADINAAGVVYIAGTGSVLGRADLPAFGITTMAVPAGVMTAVAFNHAGTQAWIPNSPTGTIALYDAASNALLATVVLGGNDIYGVLVSADDQTVYAGDGGGNFYAVSTATRSVLWEINVGGPVVHLAAHPSQPLVYASTPSGVFEINLASRANRRLGNAGHSQAVAVSSDGAELYIADENGDMQVVALPGGAITTVPIGCGGYGLVLTPDDDRIFVSCTANGTIKVVDRATRAVVGSIQTGGMPRRLAISPDGKTIVAPNEEGWVDFIR